MMRGGVRGWRLKRQELGLKQHTGGGKKKSLTPMPEEVGKGKKKKSRLHQQGGEVLGRSETGCIGEGENQGTRGAGRIRTW